MWPGYEARSSGQPPPISENSIAGNSRSSARAAVTTTARKLKGIVKRIYTVDQTLVRIAQGSAKCARERRRPAKARIFVYILNNIPCVPPYYEYLYSRVH